MYEFTKYARVFDADCPAWENNRQMNMVYMHCMENYFNDLLKYRGYVFLRDIYEKLGFSVSKDSITAGYHKCDTDHVCMRSIMSSDWHDPDMIVDFENVNEDITQYF